MRKSRLSLFDRLLVKLYNRAAKLREIQSDVPSGARCFGNPELLQIGLNVSFGGDVTLFALAPIRIGDYTMIGFGSVIHTATHDHSSHPMWAVCIGQPIDIGAHVWVGTCAVVLPGVTIENYSVVAAGAVVTANVPEGAIVAGNPARIIKMRKPEHYAGSPVINTPGRAEFKMGPAAERFCKWK